MSSGYRYWAATPQVIEAVPAGSPAPETVTGSGRAVRITGGVPVVESAKPREKSRRGRRQAVALAVRDLATTLGAGLPVERALQFAAWHCMHWGVARDLRKVLDEVHEGRALSAALRDSNRWDPFAVAVVQAGEGNGLLDEALTRLAAHYERSEDLHSHVRAQLFHPVVMAVVAGLSLLMLLWFVVPRFFTALGEPVDGLPLAARLLAMVSTGIADWWRLWLPVVLGAAVWCRIWISLPLSRRWWHQWRLRLPRIGAVEAALSTAEFARALGVLLSSGAPVPEALRAAREVVTNEALGAALDDAATAASRGARLSDALSGTLPPLAVELLATGEERGRLGQISTRVAAAYDAEAARTLRSLSRLLEPALVVGFALVAGYVIFALLQALHFVNAGLA